jgi:5,10-methylenetetrahydrofolate reductase
MAARISRLQEKLEAGEFVVTAEVSPPKGADCGLLLRKAAELVPVVDAINVTDNQGANMHVSPVAAAALLVREGIEPVLQLTCRDRNRLALQSELLGAAALGIVNVLALSGDHISFGDHAAAKPVFDLDSVQLLQSIATLGAGSDLSGASLQGVPSFFAGAAAAPESEPFPLTLMKLEKKVTAGARFLQTQAIFFPEKLQSFRAAVAHLPVRVIAGVIVLKSAAMARYINRHIPGLTVPEAVIAELETAANPESKGLEIACRLAAAVRPWCDGIHVMAMGREDTIKSIVKEVL